MIPLIVGGLYLGMGYPSWVIANLLLGGQVQRPQTRYALFAVPIIAAFVMTQQLNCFAFMKLGRFPWEPESQSDELPGSI